MGSREASERILSEPGIRELLYDMQKDNPKTAYFENPTSYRYFDSEVDHVRFCWSCHKNIAGFYLSWIETGIPDGWERSSMVAHKVKTRAKEMMKRWRDEYDEKNG